MAEVRITEQKEVHINSQESYMDILRTAHTIADVEESRGMTLSGMAFPQPQFGGGMVLLFRNEKGGGGDSEPEPEGPPENPVEKNPYPLAGFYGLGQ